MDISHGFPEGIQFYSKNELDDAIHQLRTCEAHQGSHYFMVKGDELKLLCFKAGLSCLQDMLDSEP